MEKGKVDVLLGLQWGDEGKGKVVDVLTPRYDVVARFQGGPNAGHTLEFEGQKYVLRSVPSGVFREGTINIIGNGVVLAPDLFMDEVLELEKSGHDVRSRLMVSRKAHLIMPTHRLLDAAYESLKGKNRVGTTGKGIGPAYTDKTGREGLRVGDIEDGFLEKYTARRERHLDMLRGLGCPIPDFSDTERVWLEGVDFLRKFKLIDSEIVVNKLLDEGKSVLCEGAQGTMLDIDFGSYPFVTSSNTVCAGACTGLGVAPGRVGEVYGITKAYCTRVGAGPFPTEQSGRIGDTIRRKGHEYGAVTGRERRCGWIDLMALRYSVMVNGVTSLVMTKSDVLDGFDMIRACTEYRIRGRITGNFPFDLEKVDEPVYTDLAGWMTDLTGMTSEDELPEAFRDYISFIEIETGCPVKIVSVGPDRKQTIERKRCYIAAR